MLRRVTGLLAVWVFSTVAFAAPSEVRASYKIFRNGILIGHTDEHFTRDQDRNGTQEQALVSLTVQ